MARVTIIGTGYLGLTHAVCLAELGHDVLAIDVDKEKGLGRERRGPVLRTGLEPLLRKNLDAGRLRFTTSFAEIGAFGEVHFLCVGTPEGEAGRADLSFIYAAADALAPHLATECLIAGKSTVPVGTARQLRSRVQALAPAGQQVDLAWNPEFLREDFAVQDSLTPDRIVLGVVSSRAEEVLREVYVTALAGGVPMLVMDLETAELVKVAANAFLATKISFINVMAEVCEHAGADVIPLAEALGHDARIGRRFLSPGPGLRRRLPAQGRPRVPAPAASAARASELAGQLLLEHGGHHRTPDGGTGWSSWPVHAAPGGTLAGKRQGRGARGGVQAQQLTTSAIPPAWPSAAA